MAEGSAIQGQDPHGNVFEACYPLLYAAETPLGGAYAHSSTVCATIAATMHPTGLEGARILDIGCGYGTTTEAIARFCPAEIVAVDSSAAMTDLMRYVLYSEEDIGAMMEERGGRGVLNSNLFDRVKGHLEHRRRIHRDGAFVRRGGKLRIITSSLINLSTEGPDGVDRFDVAIANNVLHWPINQARGRLTRENVTGSPEHVWRLAVSEVLQSIWKLLKPNGLLVVMEPKDFIKLDDPHLEADAERHTGVAHPAFLRFHTILNELLRDRHGIERAVPTTTGLLPVNKLREIALSSNLTPARFIPTDTTLHGEFISKIAVGAHMLMGQLDLTFQEKVALVRDTMERFVREITDAEATEPNWQQFYYLVFTRAR